MSHDLIASLMSEMANRGFDLIGQVKTDGNIHRYACHDKPKKQNRWYVFNITESVLHGSYGDWRTGEIYNFTSTHESEMDWLTKMKFESERKRQQKLYDDEKKKRADEAKVKAIFISTKLVANAEHEYVTRKQIGIAEHCGVYESKLYIPAVCDGVVVGMQIIHANGDKRWITGTPQHNICFPIGSGDNPAKVFIAEGYATAYSVWLATQCLTIVAFTKNNLLNVAEYVRKEYPKAEIIICADNDADGGGEKYATRAAEIINGKVELCPVVSDYNDMHVAQGIYAVRLCLLGSGSDSSQDKERKESLPDNGNPIKANIKSNKDNDNDKHDFIKNQAKMQLPEHLLDAPNLIGMLAKWINDTSLRYQPNLALAASIAAVGVVMGHRYRTETDLRSNIMTMGLSSSGSGKEHARKRIDLLFSLTDMSDYVIGEFASDASVISALHKRNGLGLSMTDEIGDSLAAMSSQKAAGYESRILKLTKELFSSANSVYRGKEYANHDGKQDAKILQQPCYCAYGTATHKQFYESMSSDKILDGFLSRWLVFCGDGYAKKDKRKKSHNPPAELVEAIKEIRQNKANPLERMEGGGLLVSQVKTKEVPISDGAYAVFDDLDNHVEDLRIAEFEKQSGLDAVYARTLEHAYKLALVAHDVKSGEIDVMVARWACELAMTLANNMIAIANEHIADGEYDKQLKAIYAYIQSGGNKGRSKSDIANRFRLPSKIRNEVLLHLTESNKICVIEDTAKNGNKKQSFIAQ
jgi:phage/plasmid primase-like uncharacterized protein